MNQKYKVAWAEPAEIELDAIIRYIAEIALAPQAALKLQRDIKGAGERLTFSPFLAVVNKELKLRKLNVGKNYAILFTVDEDKKSVFIKHVVDLRRDWSRLFDRLNQSL